MNLFLPVAAKQSNKKGIIPPKTQYNSKQLNSVAPASAQQCIITRPTACKPRTPKEPRVNLFMTPSAS